MRLQASVQPFRASVSACGRTAAFASALWAAMVCAHPTSTHGADEQPKQPALEIQAWLPEDLKALLREGNWKAIFDRGIREFDSQLGTPFPRISGKHRGKLTELPEAFRGRKTAVLVAGGPCSLTLRWLDQLRESNWEVPGYDALVVLTLYDGRDAVTTRVKHGIPRFEVSMPLPGYLAYLQWYPMMFFVDERGMFEGFQDSPTAPRRMKNGG